MERGHPATPDKRPHNNYIRSVAQPAAKREKVHNGVVGNCAADMCSFVAPFKNWSVAMASFVTVAGSTKLLGTKKKKVTHPMSPR